MSSRGALWIVGAVALLAGLITNCEKIVDAVRPHRVETIPDLAVKLRNTGDIDIVLPRRGEYWLWLPGGGARHHVGAYELREHKNVDIPSQVITVRANGDRELRIHLANPALAGYLATGDYHIDFIFRTDQNGGNMVWSGMIPFTKKALSEAYLIDLFEETDAENR